MVKLITAPGDCGDAPRGPVGQQRRIAQHQVASCEEVDGRRTQQDLQRSRQPDLAPSGM
jgi:hypothetical protein